MAHSTATIGCRSEYFFHRKCLGMKSIQRLRAVLSCGAVRIR
jgi:hypothetical protein